MSFAGAYANPSLIGTERKADMAKPLKETTRMYDNNEVEISFVTGGAKYTVKGRVRELMSEYQWNRHTVQIEGTCTREVIAPEPAKGQVWRWKGDGPELSIIGVTEGYVVYELASGGVFVRSLAEFLDGFEYVGRS